ncbi:hypothetical protein [Tautonia rosea]|uniref:hypothetical protein n=1 Tax=Tautonia rosea TaxID=2728037 RepID=UPI001474E62A|nr:hypothetical protein [Tautonia rosea]
MNVFRWIPISLLMLLISVGCGSNRVNQSPTPDQDPERYARALQEDERVRRANQEAEAMFFQAARFDLAEADSPPSPRSDHDFHHTSH